MQTGFIGLDETKRNHIMSIGRKRLVRKQCDSCLEKTYVLNVTFGWTTLTIEKSWDSNKFNFNSIISTNKNDQFTRFHRPYFSNPKIDVVDKQKRAKESKTNSISTYFSSSVEFYYHWNDNIDQEILWNAFVRSYKTKTSSIQSAIIRALVFRDGRYLFID